ncbi:MAG: hypothetical protein K1X94_23900 [Sandaracinaceae bacterium]|nr:hypothetical protein [Sandaracinaceae bacterium]
MPSRQRPRFVALDALALLALLGLAPACGSTEATACSSTAPCPSAEQVCDHGVCRWPSQLDVAMPPDAPSPALDTGASLDAGGSDASTASTDASVAHDASVDAASLDARATALDAAAADAWSCRSNDDCTSSDAATYCETSGRACGEGGGLCLPRPSSADCLAADGEPSCGCDGLLYASACWRGASGVAAADPSVCADPSIHCRLENDHADCPADQVCESDATATSVCPSTGAGTCRPIEASCASLPAAGSIECGCDGRTYASTCARRRARVRLAGLGFCTCDATHPCVAADTFCDGGLAYSSAECGARTDGVCARVPTDVDCDLASREPVQSCDLSDTVTRSDCQRRAARVPRAFAPPDCPEPPTRAMSCFDDADCAGGGAGNHCYGAVCRGSTGGTAGTCRARPVAPSCLADADCDPGWRCGGAGICDVDPLAVVGS